MTNVTPIFKHMEPEDVMTTGEVARLFHKSIPTIRALTIRSWHPLPYINTGSGKKVQRIFHRPAVVRWLEEEVESTRKPAESEPGVQSSKKAS